jgi:hypothetical protein
MRLQKDGGLNEKQHKRVGELNEFVRLKAWRFWLDNYSVFCVLPSIYEKKVLTISNNEINKDPLVLQLDDKPYATDSDWKDIFNQCETNAGLRGKQPFFKVYVAPNLERERVNFMEDYLIQGGHHYSITYKNKDYIEIQAIRGRPVKQLEKETYTVLWVLKNKSSRTISVPSNGGLAQFVKLQLRHMSNKVFICLGVSLESMSKFPETRFVPPGDSCLYEINPLANGKLVESLPDGRYEATFLYDTSFDCNTDPLIHKIKPETTIPLRLHIGDKSVTTKYYDPYIKRLNDTLTPLFGVSDFFRHEDINSVFGPALKGDNTVRATGAVDLAMRWLNEAQELDGHWDSRRFGAQADADLEQTAMGLLALLGAGHTEKVGLYKERVQRAVKWLSEQQSADGSFVRKDNSAAEGVVQALIGLALTQAAGMSRTPQTKEIAQKLLNYAIEKHQSHKETLFYGFGKEAQSNSPDLFTTTIFALYFREARRIGIMVPEKSVDGLIRFLDDLDKPSELSFRMAPNEPLNNYATVLGATARAILGADKTRLKPYWKRIKEQYCWPYANDENTDCIINHFFGLMCLYIGDHDELQQWIEVMRKSYLDAQIRDGLAAGSWNPCGIWRNSGRVSVTAWNILTLELHYRYLPVWRFDNINYSF